MSKFITGDVVFVKDKNNPITIEVVFPNLYSEQEYQCVWFDLEREINRDSILHNVYYMFLYP